MSVFNFLKIEHAVIKIYPFYKPTNFRGIFVKRIEHRFYVHLFVKLYFIIWS